MNEMAELFDKINELPSVTDSCRIKRNMVYIVLQDYIDYVNLQFDILREEQNKLCGPTDVILFNGRRYEGSVFGITQTIHPSLETRLEQWRMMSADTKRYITMIENWLGAILMKSKSIADIRALIPDEYFPYMENNIDTYKPHMMALCRVSTPTLSPETIAQFHKTHQSTMDVLSVFKLNQLTA